MFTRSDELIEYRLSDQDWESLDADFGRECFNRPDSGLDWDDLKEHVATIQTSSPSSYVVALVRALGRDECVIGLVYHSPAQGAYRIPPQAIGEFVERMWMGPADLFFVDPGFRWSVSMTHHREVILQVRPR